MYTTFILYENHIISRERTQRLSEVISEEIVGILKKRVLYAQNIVLDLNYSSSLKKLYLSHVTGTSLDSYSLSSIKNELKATQTSSGLMVDGTIIFLNYSDRAYTSSSIIGMEEEYQKLNRSMPYMATGTVKDLLGFENSKRYSFNKEYFIYCDDYTYQNGTNIGLICIMFNLDTLKSEITKTLDDGFGATILLNGEGILNVGDTEGNGFSSESSFMPEITVKLYAPKGGLLEENITLIVMLITIFVISVTLIVLAYWFSRRYYQPINRIEKLVVTQNTSTDSETVSLVYPDESEMDYIIREIQNLIGEKNRYHEKMLTITPYAQTGMLHGVLTGNMEEETIQVLTKENYLDLIKPYFIVSVVNFAYQEQMSVKMLYTKIQDLLDKACKVFSTDEIHLVYYNRDIYNAFLIANIENDEPLDEMFYQIHKFIQENLREDKCIVTMGVDETKDNIDALKDACEGALNALNEMITGGRGEVYFNDSQRDKSIDYYFPRNFSEKISKYIKKGRIDDIKKLLNDIYTKNWELDAAPEMYHALVDELHLSIIKTLKNMTDLNTIHISIEKMDMTATLEEIFNYYETAFESITKSLQQAAESQAEDEQLEERILEFLEENYCNPDISMQYLIDYFNVSSKYLSLFCKKHFDATYLQYIQQKRITKAIELVKTGKHSLKEISAMCGYTNLLTFRRNFKSYTGVNPSDYPAQ